MSQFTNRVRIGVGLLLLAVALAMYGGVDLPIVNPPAPVLQITSATYVYEKDDTAIPSEVMVGLNRLNRELKIVATLFEQDSTDGEGEVPDQYKVAAAAAKESGLPALVVQSSDKVIRTVKDPRTASQIWEAAQ